MPYRGPTSRCDEFPLADAGYVAPRIYRLQADVGFIQSADGQAVLVDRMSSAAVISCRSMRNGGSSLSKIKREEGLQGCMRPCAECHAGWCPRPSPQASKLSGPWSGWQRLRMSLERVHPTDFCSALLQWDAGHEYMTHQIRGIVITYFHVHLNASVRSQPSDMYVPCYLSSMTESPGFRLRNLAVLERLSAIHVHSARCVVNSLPQTWSRPYEAKHIPMTDIKLMWHFKRYFECLI